MDQAYKDRIDKLKRALLDFLAADTRHYGELSRQEQNAQDLAQALNTSLDQLSYGLSNGNADEVSASPRQQLSDRLLDTALALQTSGKVDQDMVDQFSAALEAFDVAADLRRKADSAQDQAETAVIKHKRGSASGK